MIKIALNFIVYQSLFITFGGILIEIGMKVRNNIDIN
jgi:hypothetical protein